MKSKSLLIIGGTGFFGKSILDYLKNDNFLNINKIIIFSRKAKNIKINVKLKRKIKIIKLSGDILKIKRLPQVDYVIYGAILNNYNQDFKAVKNYLNLAIKYHYNSKILYVSSGAVYGIQKSKIRNFKENYLTKYKKINFKNGYKKNYSINKFKNENLFKEFAKKKGVHISIARCFSFVGRHIPQDSYYVIGNIINNILNKKNINIKANYKIIRSYMYSDDLANWLLKILDNSNRECPIYNVGSDDRISIHSIAYILSKKYNLKFNLKNKILNNVIDKYIPNIRKANKDLSLINHYNSLGAIIKTINLLKNEKIN
jgi:nucleoside-diphosphate-sugar epimerase